MFVTIAFHNFSAAIREGQNLAPTVTDDELAVRLDKHSEQLWNEVRKYGIEPLGMAEHTSTVAAFQVSIAGVGTNYDTGGFNFQRLCEGLSWVRPTAITVEESDLKYLVPNAIMADAAESAWPEIAHNFQRILPGELFHKIETIVPKLAFNREMPRYIDEAGPEADAANREVHDYEYQRMLDRLGLEDPAKKSTEIEQYRQAEVDAYRESHPQEFPRSWGVVDPDTGRRY